MPEFIRPRRAVIETGGGGGGLVLIAVGVVAAAVVVGFIAAHFELLAVCGAAFVAVMGAVLAAMRWLASSARLRRQLHPWHTAKPIAARPAQAIPVARPRAIEAARTIPAATAVNRERRPCVR